MKKVDKFSELERIFGTRKPVIGMVHLALYRDRLDMAKCP